MLKNDSKVSCMTTHHSNKISYVSVLTDEDIVEIQDIFLAEFGVELTRQQALDVGERLLSLFGVIYKPIPDDNESI